MTYQDAVKSADELMPNAYAEDQKYRWLLRLDQQIYDELIATHVSDVIIERPENTNGTETLLVPDTYADDIYLNFLMAMICKHNEEDAKFNKYITLYNDGYKRFARRYHELHAPIVQSTHFVF